MREKIKYFLRNHTIWIIAISLFIFFTIASPYFCTIGNFIIILKGIAVMGIMAIGITFLLISQNYDLSIGSTLALAAALAINIQPYGIFISVITAILTGFIIGLINGLLVTKAKINSFVVTLVTMTCIRGFVYIVTDETTLSGTAVENLSFGSIPYYVILFLILFSIAHYSLKNTIFGRNIYAIGGNISAAKDSGINVDRNIIAAFVICGITAATAGVIFAFRMNAAMPTLGESYAISVITAVVLGGVKLSGGRGSMTHMFGGICVVEMLQNGMDMIGIESRINTLVMGMLLVAVVLVDKRFRVALHEGLKRKS